MFSTIPDSTIYALLTAHFIAFSSFLGAAIFRLAENPLSLVTGLSGCRSCGAPVRIWHMVPVVSWLALRGRCLRCHSPLSPIYPIVEGGTMLSWIVAVLVTHGPLPAFALGMLGGMLLALAIMEVRVGRLSEALALPLAMIGLGLALLAPWGGVSPIQSLAGAALAGAIALAVRLGQDRQLFRLPDSLGPMGACEAILLTIAGFWTGIVGLGLVLVLAVLAKLLARHLPAPAVAWPLGPWLAAMTYLITLARPFV